MKVESSLWGIRHPAVGGARFSVSSHVLPGLMVCLDSLAILSAGLIPYAIFVGNIQDAPGLYAVALCFVWLVTIMLMKFAGLYQLEPIMRPIAFADKVLGAFATTILFFLAAAFSVKVSSDFSRLWIGNFAIGACATTLLLRLAAATILSRLANRQIFTRHVVIAGSGEQAKKLLASVDAAPPRFISVLGIFAEASDRSLTGSEQYPLLGNFDGLVSYARNHAVDDIIIALPWSAEEQISALVDKLRELPVNIYLGSDLIGFRLPFRSPPDHFGETPIVEVMGRPLAGWGGLQKTILDYGLSIIALVGMLPVMALIAIAIKLDSDGPVLFRQKRQGFVNRVFYIYKFRTMRHAPTPECRTLQATRNDPRVTRIGRFLRHTSLDELPQLFNVLNGTMSLVGPRPHATDHDEEFSQTIRGYFARHRVKPGITGWAQVNGFRGETKSREDIEARVRHDIEYTENWSVLFDLKILFRTVLICLTGRNAY